MEYETWFLKMLKTLTPFCTTFCQNDNLIKVIRSSLLLFKSYLIHLIRNHVFNLQDKRVKLCLVKVWKSSRLLLGQWLSNWDVHQNLLGVLLKGPYFWVSTFRVFDSGYVESSPRLHFELGRRGPDAEFRGRILRITTLGKTCKGLRGRTSPLVSLLQVCHGWVCCFLLWMCIFVWLLTRIVSNWEIGFMVFGRRVARYETIYCCRKGDPLPGPKSELLSDTRKWIVRGDNTSWPSKRLYWGGGAWAESKKGRKPRRTTLPCSLHPQ